LFHLAGLKLDRSVLLGIHGGASVGSQTRLFGARNRAEVTVVKGCACDIRICLSRCRVVAQVDAKTMSRHK
jgi:hypothetical protein